MNAGAPAVQRRLRARGVVQGVGFRPFVWRLARDLGLTGWVRNDAAGVEILVAGAAEAVACFTARLQAELPPLARLDGLTWQDEAAAGDAPHDFRILASGGGVARTMIGHDTAVCADCLRELFDPADRRWRYAFINCTACGPRYTITHRLPYDRAHTSMAAFPLCAQCAREYHDPTDRRFHAEPTACPACGPRLTLEPLPPHHSPLTPHPSPDPIAAALALLRGGAIVAIKGLGGYHLACDARDARAVARLRARKGREAKPFAVMAANLASLAAWVEATPPEQALLEAPERPIVLLRKRPRADAAFPGVAPGLAWLGVMLPYTPLHWLLFHEAAGRPAGTGWMREAQDLVLVMTSANPGGEPIVIAEDEARTRLAGLADAMLTHDRTIVVRCDDSVVRLDPSSPLHPHSSLLTPHTSHLTPSPSPTFFRRARGYTPRAIRLPRSGPSVLALGGMLKNTICVTRDDEAFLSQHIGGLDNAATCAILTETVEHLLAILEVRPAAVAHDLHPDFHSTRHALALAQGWGVPAIAVQHHHAHIAAIAAEHGVEEPLLGLALDGVGLGTDGSAWGGELLRLEEAGFARLGHLAPLPLPGGDRAAREPWRMAAAVLHRLGRGAEIPQRFQAEPLAPQLRDWLARAADLPHTTSLGRYFDAAAALLGVCTRNAYEGQAAMLLEGLAESAARLDVAPGWCAVDQGRGVHWTLAPDLTLDLLPLLARLADETDPALGARLFHDAVAAALADWALAAAGRTGSRRLALAGGCLLNARLKRRLCALLVAAGIEPLTAHAAPPNDGGLSLGQAWVALQTFAAGSKL
ncbi:MAG: carbamoyltransferase HypF [Thiobacillaceae bacterium]|nr:carbamoyltransferase HypF [Thiobacillaceae bacterium]MDW8323615.1 carbamoyltransferase HypF [Burkholderiales bacterium]